MKLMTAKEFMETALAADSGYYIVFSSEEDAKRFRLACYQARSRERKTNNRLYLEDPEYIEHCHYDALKFTITASEDGYWLLMAEPVDLNLEHTAHGVLTPEVLERIRSGQPIAPQVDEVSPAPSDGVDNG